MKNRSGLTLAEIIIILLIIALLGSLAIPNFMRLRITKNESTAQSNLRTIAAGFERFAAANKGRYPKTEEDLHNESLPYLNKVYDNQLFQGYRYKYQTLSTTGYVITASPATPGKSGNTTYTISTGGALNP